MPASVCVILSALYCALPLSMAKPTVFTFLYFLAKSALSSRFFIHTPLFDKDSTMAIFSSNTPEILFNPARCDMPIFVVITISGFMILLL